MADDKLLQIGELAEKCGVSVQTIRYYSKIGLLKPDYIDEQTNYRYYSPDKSFLIVNTLLLKSAGFKLSEIKEFFKKGTIKEVIKTYNSKLSRINQDINKLYETRTQVEYYLKFFSLMLEQDTNYKTTEFNKITTIEIPDKKIIYVRDEILFDYPTTMLIYNQLIKRIFEIKAEVDNHILSIFHHDYKDLYHKKINFELAMEIQNNINHKDYIRTIPGKKYIKCLHKGKYPSSIQTYNEMLEYADKTELKQSGPVMHYLLVPIASAKQPENTVFEIYMPVE